jgi:phage terminase large subunit-like protein
MVRNNKSLRERIRIVPSAKRMIRTDDPSIYYAALSADGDIHDGIQPSFVVRDELHRWRTRKAYDLNEILERGMITRRECMVIDITTAGVADESPLCWRRHEYARQIEEGVFTDKRFYGRVWAANSAKLQNDPLYWTTREARVEANPSHEDNGGYLRDSVLEDMCIKAQNDPIAASDFKRYHLNVWGQAATRWMPMEIWRGCDTETRALMGRECYAGIDLAGTTDLSALVLLFPDRTDDSYDVLPFFWMPENNVRKRELTDHVPYSEWVKKEFIETTPGSAITLSSIKKRVKWCQEMFDLREVAYDPNGAEELISGENGLIDEGLTCVPVKQGFASLSAPMLKLMELCVTKKLRHGGNPVLTWNADCVEAKSDGNDLIRPVKPYRATSNKRIDGVVALIEAIDRAIRVDAKMLRYSPVKSLGG